MPAVLIVDDNPPIVELLTAILAAKGFGVLAADDAAGIETALARCQPDLILMDMLLRGSDGLTLTRKLKGDPGTCDIPIIALTGLATADDEARALQAGCIGYLSKPFRPQALLDLMHQVLSRRGAASP